MWKQRTCVVLLSGLILTSVAAAADPNLVGWWKLDETAGATAADSSGAGNNGTLNGGPQWVAGQLKGALQLNGTNQYVECGNGASLNFRAQVSLAAWIKPNTAANGQHQVFVCKGDHCFALKHNSGNYVEFNVYDGAWFTARNPSVNASWNGVWHHVAGTYDGTTLKIYLDGVLVPASATASHVGRIASTTYSVTIGRDNEGSGRRYYNGTIDDVRIYNRALAPEEIPVIMAGTPEGASSEPNPASHATDVRRDTALAWTAGPYAATHDVYLGTPFADVNTAGRADAKGVLVSQGQAETTFTPATPLAYGQTYYWRVDEVNAPPDITIFKGDVWSFTVEPYAYPLKPAAATASSFQTNMGPEKTIDGSGLTGDLHGTDSDTMWLTATAPNWIQYEFDQVSKLQTLEVWNSNQMLEAILHFSAKKVTIETSLDGTTWTPVPEVPEFAAAPGAAGYAANTTVNLGGVLAKYVKLTIESNWGGIAPQSGLSEVRFYAVPLTAREPNPASGATAQAVQTTLSWRSGHEAAAHEVYLSTDQQAVLDGTAPKVTTTPARYDAALALGQTYYWKVVEVNQAKDAAAWEGPVWSFSTVASLPVDDFERYTNLEGESLWDYWSDGFNNPQVNGAVVGNDVPPAASIAELTIIHGGKQSMPLRYNNAAGVLNSETTRPFDSVQDWTAGGATTLTLCFYGAADNATNVPLWVELTDQSNKSAKVTFGAAGEDVTALADPAWTRWDIPLSGFAGMSLARIQSLTIGLGPGTGTGRLLIDDIELRPAGAAATEPAVLVGYWKMDGNAQDGSGNGNDGTLNGGPTWAAAGKIGGALSLDGVDDYVDCGNGASLNITDTITLSAWVNPADVGNSQHNPYITKGDHAYALKHGSGNTMQFYIYDGTWRTVNGPVLTSSFNGSWHHVAGTYDGVQVKLYVDGVLVASRLWTGKIASATYNVNIGRNTESTTRLYQGLIDEVRIYHGVLPKSEVIKLANP